MAERRPLVVVSGTVQELPAGDTLPGGGGGGVPAGGTTGQVLAKNSNTDFDVGWAAGGGGGGDQITVSATPPALPTLNQLWLDIS